MYDASCIFGHAGHPGTILSQDVWIRWVTVEQSIYLIYLWYGSFANLIAPADCSSGLLIEPVDGGRCDNWTSKSDGWKSRLDWLILCLGCSFVGHRGASLGLFCNFGLLFERRGDSGLSMIFWPTFGLEEVGFGIEAIFVCLTVRFGIAGRWFAWSEPHNEVNIPLPWDLLCDPIDKEFVVWPQVIGLLRDR